MSNNIVTLHRILQAPPQKVFRAFSQASAYASWIPPYGFVCEVEKMNFQEGGTFRMAFINFSTGKKESFGGTMVKIRPDAFIQYKENFDDPQLPGEMTTSVWLREVSAGTELKITQENIPAAILIEMCYLGWQDSLEKLKKLVEPEIPDA